MRNALVCSFSESFFIFLHKENLIMRNTVLISVLLMAIGLMIPSAQGSLIGHWALDEGSGTTALDSSGNNYDGTISGGATYTTGAPGFGDALDFNGSSNEVLVPHQSALNLVDTDYTIAFWTKWGGANAGGTGQNMAAMDSGWNGWYIGLEGAVGSEKLKLGHLSGKDPWGGAPKSTLWYVDTNDFNLNDNIDQWAHVAVVYSKTASNCDLYIDGSHVASNYTGYAISAHPTAEALSLGSYGRYTPSLNYYNGALDDFRVYNNALSAGEVAELATVPEPSSIVMLCAGLLGLVMAYRRRRK